MRDRRARGFSLIELMVAIVILMIAVLGVTPLFSSSIFNDAESRTSSAAATLAETRIEMLKSVGFAGIANGNESTTIDNMAYASSWVVTDVVANTLKKVVVTVSWGNPTRAVVMSTYMAKQ